MIKRDKENDEMKHKYWEDIRKMFWYKVEPFIQHMRVFQGDRRFLPWKGSVLDSVVGAFLTQNVSDHLSTSAFMTLGAKFPTKTIDWEAVHKSVKLLKPSNLVDNTTLLQEGYSYMLPDKHPLLAECIPRELDDPSPYLLVEWTTGDLESSCESTKNNLQEEENSLTVQELFWFLLITLQSYIQSMFQENGYGI
ncbi:hypothetical protein JHK82_034278 [Glycine max]|nr:hypothetical protein JHK85_034989 [Glycine max]KAG4986656.1 hypothetical protein JHK86_034347 [Glycine max]KAG5119858.1 hypothetical protein JHK82_034278 [Glycine max]KAG5140848.1 hypothetical protein JHK84_034616 [Glycine max]